MRPNCTLIVLTYPTSNQKVAGSNLANCQFASGGFLSKALTFIHNCESLSTKCNVMLCNVLNG